MIYGRAICKLYDQIQKCQRWQNQSGRDAEYRERSSALDRVLIVGFFIESDAATSQKIHAKIAI